MACISCVGPIFMTATFNVPSGGLVGAGAYVSGPWFGVAADAGVVGVAMVTVMMVMVVMVVISRTPTAVSVYGNDRPAFSIFGGHPACSIRWFRGVDSSIDGLFASAWMVVSPGLSGGGSASGDMVAVS